MGYQPTPAGFGLTMADVATAFEAIGNAFRVDVRAGYVPMRPENLISPRVPITPPPRSPSRHRAYCCVGCGAPLAPREESCSYCGRSA